MRAEKAEKRPALHPAIGRGATLELGVVGLRGGATGVPVVKVNFPGFTREGRNATSRYRLDLTVFFLVLPRHTTDISWRMGSVLCFLKRDTEKPQTRLRSGKPSRILNSEICTSTADAKSAGVRVLQFK